MIEAVIAIVKLNFHKITIIPAAVIRGRGRREQGGADQPGAAEAAGARSSGSGSCFPEFRLGGKFKTAAREATRAAHSADLREDLLRGRFDQVGPRGRHHVGEHRPRHPRREEPRAAGAALGHRGTHPGTLHGEVLNTNIPYQPSLNSLLVHILIDFN